MDHRSLWAVLAGTFTLRFSTGLTGAMLGFYLATLPEHGGQAVDAVVVGLFAAIFYLAELVLSPFFGILSDRLGHHRVMLFGPVFGGDRGRSSPALTTNLLVLGGTRLLEGASTAASVPSILGYIALATAGNEIAARQGGGALRGRDAGRARGRVHRGAQAVRGPRTDRVLPQRGHLRRLVPHLPARRQGPGRRARGRGRAARRAPPLPRPDPHVARLAARADLDRGQRLDRAVVQPVALPVRAGEPGLPRPGPDGGFTADQITLAAIVIAVVFGAGLLYWGNRFKTMRRTTIILYGIVGGGVLVAGRRWSSTTAIGAARSSCRSSRRRSRPGGLFVLAGATPAALGLLADMSERVPGDRGAIMGLYSVFLAIGQIVGSLIGGVAADWRGIDGMLLATLGAARHRAHPAVARLRREEHRFDVGGTGRCRRRRTGERERGP